MKNSFSGQKGFLGQIAVGICKSLAPMIVLYLAACKPTEEVDCEDLHKKVNIIVNPCEDGQQWSGFRTRVSNMFSLSNANVETPDCTALITYFDKIYGDFGETVIDPRHGLDFATSKPSSNKRGGRGCTVFFDGDIECSRTDPFNIDNGEYNHPYPISPPDYVDPDMNDFEIIKSFTDACIPEMKAVSRTLPTPG